MKKTFAAAIAAFMILFSTVFAFANAAEPPCFTVIVQNAPENLTLYLKLPDGAKEEPVVLRKEKKAWETYYRFYYGDAENIILSVEGSEIVCENGDKSFSCAVPKETTERYNSILTLDLKKQTLSYGQPGWRIPILVALRVLLTLLIEGAVFFAFGYRKPKSWLIFAAVNLLTQISLNAFITGPLLNSYWLFGYVIAEALIFVAEAVAFAFLIKEHSKKRAVFCAIAANAASLLAGGWLISNLPV